jgi:ABC-type Fe3+-siderophore transport system permease subunit
VAVFFIGPVVLLLLLVFHVTQGQAGLDYGTVFRAIFSPDGSTAHDIVRQVRLPRAAAVVVAGAALAMAGVLAQAVTRNPLASPTTLGVNWGAYLAVVAAAVFLPGLSGILPVSVAFAGGLLAALLVYAIAASVHLTPVRLALAGSPSPCCWQQ